MLPLVFTVPHRIFGSYSGFSWFIFVWISRAARDREEVVNHEKIHFYQQVELFFIVHWILYGWYYFEGRRKGFSHHEAYRRIPFEREAYFHESDFGYLKARKRFAWRKFC